MRKMLCAVFTAAAVMAGTVSAGMPAAVYAAGTANDKASVHFSAGVPGEFDMVDEQLEVRGNLAEKYFPEIAENEPEGVSFADALVAAHVKKFGSSNVEKYLKITADPEGSKVTKQFGHTSVGKYYVNDAVCSDGVSNAIRSRDRLYAGAAATESGDFGYSYFEKKGYAVTVGKTIKVKACYNAMCEGKTEGLMSETTSALSNAKLAQADKKTGKLNKMSATTNSNGVAAVSFKEPGDKYISLIGKADTGEGVNSLAGAVAKIKVILARAKVTKKSAAHTSVTLKWKKVAGAKNYEIYKSSKRFGKFKKAGVSKTTKFVNKKLKDGKTFFYKVRAVAKSEGKTIRGEFSQTVKVKTKKIVKVAKPSPRTTQSSAPSKSKSKTKSKKPSSNSSSNSTINRLRKLFDIFK